MFFHHCRHYLLLLVTSSFLSGLMTSPLHLTLLPSMTLTLNEEENGFQNGFQNDTFQLGRNQSSSKSRLLLFFDFTSLRKTLNLHLELGQVSYISQADLVIQCLTFIQHHSPRRSWRVRHSQDHLDLVLSRVLKPWNKNANWKYTGIAEKWTVPYLDLTGYDATYPMAR